MSWTSLFESDTSTGLLDRREMEEISCVCESAVDTSNVAEEALEVVVIVVAKIKAVTLVDTDIMAHSLCQVPVANTQLSDSLHTSVVVMTVEILVLESSLGGLIKNVEGLFGRYIHSHSGLVKSENKASPFIC